MKELSEINKLEKEAIYLSHMNASKHEVNATITEMMTLTKKYLGEVNSYFDDINKVEPDLKWGTIKD